jgi:hypothetical protein
MRIYNPTCPPSFFGVLVAKIMATPTHRRKVFVAAKPLSNPPRFMMDVLTLGFLAPLAYRVESQMGFANLCILLVFTLALGGCIPQPSAALEALRSFEGSF